MPSESKPLLPTSISNTDLETNTDKVTKEIKSLHNTLIIVGVIIVLWINILTLL